LRVCFAAVFLFFFGLPKDSLSQSFAFFFHSFPGFTFLLWRWIFTRRLSNFIAMFPLIQRGLLSVALLLPLQPALGVGPLPPFFQSPRFPPTAVLFGFGRLSFGVFLHSGLAFFVFPQPPCRCGLRSSSWSGIFSRFVGRGRDFVRCFAFPRSRRQQLF